MIFHGMGQHSQKSKTSLFIYFESSMGYFFGHSDHIQCLTSYYIMQEIDPKVLFQRICSLPNLKEFCPLVLLPSLSPLLLPLPSSSHLLPLPLLSSSSHLSPAPTSQLLLPLLSSSPCSHPTRLSSFLPSALIPLTGRELFELKINNIIN